MPGYDLVVLKSFYGQPNFLRRFGVPAPETQIGYVIPPAWQSGMSNGAAAGGILGLLVSCHNPCTSSLCLRPAKRMGDGSMGS